MRVITSSCFYTTCLFLFSFTVFTAIEQSQLLYIKNTLYNTIESLIQTIHFYMVYLEKL